MLDHNVKYENKLHLFYPEIKYATYLEILLIIIGIASAIGAGICMPMLIVFFGKLSDSFIKNSIDLPLIASKSHENHQNAFFWFSYDNSTRHSDVLPLKEAVSNFVNGMFIIGTIQMIFGTVFVTALNYCAIKQARRFGQAYFKAILYSPITWFDLQHPQDISYTLIKNVNSLCDGLGEKMGIMVYTALVSVTCLAYAICYDWKLFLIAMIILPLIMFFFSFMKKTKVFLKSKEKKAYSSSEALAKDIIKNIRSVAAYNGGILESKRFKKSLEASEMSFLRRSGVVGLLSGCLWFVMYCSYALTFYSGVTSLHEHSSSDNQPSSLIIVFFCVQIATINMLKLPGYVKLIKKARLAALEMQTVVERIPEVYMEVLTDIHIPETLSSISFKNVTFCYPTKPYTKVLQGITFDVHEGENVVLTGVSGCGKTTCLRLIHRFYNIQSGTICINDNNIYGINLKSLRSRIGYVKQNSVLFGTTVIQSVCYGLYNVSRKDILDVLKIVGVNETILRLSKQYNSPLNNDLEPGLRQRLAIARVLLQKPDILLLDYAMMDLCVKEELRILKEIIQYREHKTMIIVSSRIPIMMMANKVFYIKDGHVHTQGSFCELMAQRGEFWNAVKRSTTLKSRLKSSLNTDNVDEFESIPCERINRMNNLSSYSLTLQSTDCNEWEYLHHDSVHICYFPQPLSMAEQPVIVGLQARDMHNFSWLKVLKLNAREWPFMLTGCIAAMITGFSLPAYSVLFVECLTEIAVQPVKDFTVMRDFFTQIFLVAGFIAGVAMIVQGYMVAVSGSKLIKRLRCLVFDSILQQEMIWFDRKSNSLHNLLMLLREDAHRAQSASGYRLVSFMQAFCLVLMSALLSIYYEWKLGLFICFAVPFMFVGYMYQSHVIIENMFQENLLLQKIKMTVDEAVFNIRAITALNLQEMFAAQYCSEALLMEKKLLNSMKWRGMIYGSMLGIPWFVYGFSASLGVHLLKTNVIQQASMFRYEYICFQNDCSSPMGRVLEALILGTIMMGQLAAFSPYRLQGQVSVIRIMKLLKTSPAKYSPSTDFYAKQKIRGNIEFKNVNFIHEDICCLPALSNFNVNIKEGEMLALIGNLGSGQSIPIQLLMRFYAPKSGNILLDGYNIAFLNPVQVRHYMGLVNGDPVFFERTIAENIFYGDNNHTLRMDTVICAAKEADIHNYVSTLPEGYNTLLTDEIVTTMTFSQKFRLSLARALIRDPIILLIENFEMAEDEYSDMLVDAAVRKACMGRTCIIISRHILAPIWNANKILVMCKGEIAEEGNHSSLLEARGLYYCLYCRQELLQRVTESHVLIDTLMNEDP